ncbi:MAG: ABC transporter ATP-binding protein [Alphaproteobacteria bacterium]
MTANPYAIVARGLRKLFPLQMTSLLRLWLGQKQTFPSFAALKDVNLRVPRGEMVGVLGANGAGKSTLLRVLAGIYRPDAGQVTMDGAYAALFELGGFGNGHLTGRNYVHRFLQLYDVPVAQHAALIEEIHEFSELGSSFEETIRTYSTGMGARLYFSTATAVQRAIYLVDEILSVGDEHFRVKSWARMRQRLASGASGVLVTHDWSAVIKLCRTACVLEHGAIVREGAADKVVADYLQLPVPAPTQGRIVAPDAFHAVSGAPLRLEFDVVLTADIAAAVAVSIEYLMLGMGWEIVVLSEYLPVAQQAGTYRVCLEMPHAPLRPGDYMVSLFLCGAPDPTTGARESLHGFSWTYGNGLKLVVTGTPRDDLAPFPVVWRQEAT